MPIPPEWPTQKQLAALRAIARSEAGEDAAIDKVDAEECDKFGWAEAEFGSRYSLTEEGRRALRRAVAN